MNFTAGLLLTYLPEAEAFGALVVLMQDRGLRRYYSTDMALLQVGGAGVGVGWGWRGGLGGLWQVAYPSASASSKHQLDSL